MGRKAEPVFDRFWRKVDVRGPGECWLWQGAPSAKGYGYFQLNVPFQMVRAHRLAYWFLVGPTDSALDHLCRVRMCVNPAHLEPVTIGENVLRGEGLTARNARKTECQHGHPFTPENTYYFGADGSHRGCRICRTAATVRYRQRNRALLAKRERDRKAAQRRG